MTRWKRYLLGIGIALFVLSVLPPELSGPLSPVLGPLGPVISLWWIFFLAGIALIAIRRWNIDTPVVAGGSTTRRHDIIRATNWSRLNRYRFRRSIAMALLVAPIPLLLLAVILQRFDIALVWAILIAVGGIWLLSLSRIEDITHDFTQKVEVRVPDLFSLHSFHLDLRRTVEDLGYITSEVTSPERGGSESRHRSDVFLAEGGFTARQESIAPSQPLTDDASGDSDTNVLTQLTVGIFLVFFGVTIIWIAPEIQPDLPESIRPLMPLFGGVLLLGGVVVTAYDYYSRTNQWKEIYCVEEGTVYTPTIDVEDRDDGTGEMAPAGSGSDHRAPGRETEVTTSQTSGVVTVTVGARSSSAVNSAELESDFETITRAIERAADEHELEISEVVADT